jgi:hypothetical protein
MLIWIGLAWALASAVVILVAALRWWRDRARERRREAARIAIRLRRANRKRRSGA